MIDDTANPKVLQITTFGNDYEYFKTSVVSYKIGIYLWIRDYKFITFQKAL